MKWKMYKFKSITGDQNETDMAVTNYFLSSPYFYSNYFFSISTFSIILKHLQINIANILSN